MGRTRTYYGLEREVGRSWLYTFPSIKLCLDWVDENPHLRDIWTSDAIHVDAKKAAKSGPVAVWYVDNYWRLA